MVYYELFGLPGAGKTTLSAPIVKRLKDDGYKVAVWDDVFHRNSYNRLKINLVVEMFFHFNEYKLYYWCWRLYKKSREPNSFFFKKLVLLLHQLLMTIKENKYDIVICDEGVIQFISSLYYLEEIQDDLFLKKIACFMGKRMPIHPICCSIDITESMKRIKNRNYGQARRYSYIAGESVLEQAMICKDKNLCKISTFFPAPIFIDMSKPVLGNVDILFTAIMDRTNS